MTTANTSSVKNKLQKKTEDTKIAPQQAFQTVITNQLTKQFKAIQSLVPKHVTPERLCRVALNAISRNPNLMNCAPETIVGAIVNCASLGLEPNLLGHAYIVPFWNSKFNNNKGRYEAQFQVGYKGALDLVRRTGAVSTIAAHEVYEGDKFDYAYGLDEKLIHVPSGEDDENKITHFYACYKLKDGGSGFIVMTRKQVEIHRDNFTKSKDKKTGKVFGPWKDHFVAMGLKTVLLKLIKYMPISIEEQETERILEGLQRDNGVSTVKESDNLGFGESFIHTDYTVNDEEVVNDEAKEKEDKKSNEDLSEEQENMFKGTPLEEGGAADA